MTDTHSQTAQSGEGVPPSKPRSGVLGKIVMALALILLALVIIISLQPSEYQVTRSATMSAPPPVVFAQVNDFHNWNDWSPWAKLDPNMKTTYEGAEAGEGAVYAWSGNSDVGEGRMTITESKPNELVKFKLEFIKPMAALCDTDFTFAPEGDATKVTWNMKGQNDFMGKAMCLIMDMDKMIGTDFEKGLASMKSIVEGKNVEGKQVEETKAGEKTE